MKTKTSYSVKKLSGNLQKTSKLIKKKKIDQQNISTEFNQKQPNKPPVQNNAPNKDVAKNERFKNIKGKSNNIKSWQKSKSKLEEKKSWTEFKKEKKLLKIKRKEGKHKDLLAFIKEAKVLYEKLKCRTTENKNILSEKLFDLLIKADCLQKFVLAHDTSRIIQCLIRYAPSHIKDEICLALLPTIVTMMQSRYAHFCVIAMLKHASDVTIGKLIECIYGSVIKLCSHNVAGKIMDTIYFEKASKTQKTCLRQEFYSDLFVNSKDLNAEHLSDTYSIIQTSKEFVLENVKNKLIHLVNKNAMDNSLVHEILLEYINECREGKVKENCDEFLKLCIPIIPHLITTKSGSKCAIYIFWHSPTKERRAILKSLKEHLQKIFTHEHGHQFILAVVNGLDDTKAIKKSIFDPLMENFDQIILDQHGRKILHWFISPADKDIFHPNLINFLEEGLIYSKKEKDLRRNEIFNQIEQSLFEKIKENPKLWVSNGNIGLLMNALLKHISEDKRKEILPLITKEITSTSWKIDDSNNELAIENAAMHHVLKKILKHDIVKSEKDEITFGEVLFNNLYDSTIELWITKNRGCFALVLLFEALNKENQVEFKRKFVTYHKDLEKSSHEGAKILLQKIKY